MRTSSLAAALKGQHILRWWYMTSGELVVLFELAIDRIVHP